MPDLLALIKTSQEAADYPEPLLEHFELEAAKIHKIYEPTLNARADLLKIIISLSSAAIALSVGFFSNLRSLKLEGRWEYRLLAISFILLALALLSAFVGMLFGLRVYRLQSGVLDVRERLREAAMLHGTAEDRLEAMHKVFVKVVHAVNGGDAVIGILTPVSLIAFVLAFTILAIVIAKQILS